MKIFYTGSQGFIGYYVVKELLEHGHTVIGIDNFSKYGKIKNSLEENSRYQMIEGDVKDTSLLKKYLIDCDQILAGAAKIGGIAYFHQFAYDLLAENERILASTFDAAIDAFKNHRLKRITVISSSMVFENATRFPTPEGHEKEIPPPNSSYGFQKLSCEYFAKAAWEQYQLPYTIVRPFNCVGIGERRALTEKSHKLGNITMALSHVVPDIAQKILKGQKPLRIFGNGNQIRNYTYGGDIARGIRLAMESEKAINEDFNISSDESLTVTEVAEMIWNKIHHHEPPQIISDPPYPYDVQKRIPDVSKAKNILNFNASTKLSKALDEIIPWIEEQIRAGTL